MYLALDLLSCLRCSQERFSALSHIFGRVLTGAAVLQSDSEFSVPQRDAACTAVSTFLMLSVASISTVLLGCREVRSTAVRLCGHEENGRDSTFSLVSPSARGNQAVLW